VFLSNANDIKVVLSASMMKSGVDPKRAANGASEFVKAIFERYDSSLSTNSLLLLFCILLPSNTFCSRQKSSADVTVSQQWLQGAVSREEAIASEKLLCVVRKR
jgi:hypothetical protein